MSTVSDKTRRELSGPAQALLARYAPRNHQTPTEFNFGAAVLSESLGILDTEGKKEVSREPSGTKVVKSTRQPTKEDTIELIDAITDSVIGPKEREMEYLFIMHTLYYVFLISAGVVVNLSPTTATAIGTLGLGSLAIGANYSNLQEAVDGFIKDRRHLKDARKQIESLEGFEKKDFPKGVPEAYDAAMAVLTSLTQQSQSSQASHTPGST